MLRFLLDTESGEYVHESYVKHAKASAFVLVPDCNNVGLLDVDGELVKSCPTLFESLPRLACLMVPAAHRDSMWCINGQKIVSKDSVAVV